MQPENDYGSEEYKLRLTDKSRDRLDQLTTQMRFRMSEGEGECTYHLGVKDDGSVEGISDNEYNETLLYLDEIARANKYTITSIYEKHVNKGKKVYELLIREHNPNKYIDIKVAVAGNVDAGKCERYGTVIRLWPSGTKEIQDISTDDLLMGDDGTPRRVLETTSGYGQMYEIIPVNGESITVNKNHILCLKASNYNYTYWDNSKKRWCVRRFMYQDGKPKITMKGFYVKHCTDESQAKQKADEYLEQVLTEKDTIRYGDIVELSLEKYVNLKTMVRSALKLYRVGIDYPEQKVDLDPYLVGYWLGDDVSSTSDITTTDQEIVDYFNEKIPEYNLQMEKVGNIENFSHDCNHFFNALRKYDLINNKHIPDIYKYNSRDVRLKLLAGLIDSNGSIRHNCYDFCMTAKNKRLCDDMIEVIRSLGFASYPQYRIKTCINGKDGPAKCECIQFGIAGEYIEQFPVLLDRKRAKPKQSLKSALTTGIKNIKILEDQKYYGFELDGNGRYLHADFTVTHNSSLLGVLTSGHLDDGRGKARTSILNYPHEQATGRTSSIAHHILGFDWKGNTVNNDRLGRMTWPEIVQKSEKVINFSDLAGHEKYLKTTILGLSSTFPDLCFIIVGANMGLTRMTKEHIFLCLTLKIPFVVIITKMDIIKDRKNVYDETMERLYTLLKLPSIRRAPYKVRNNDDVLLCAEKIYHDTLTPIFHVSNVTGEGINELKMFLNLTKKRKKNYHVDDPVEYHIDTIFKNVKGVGVVVGGNLITGTLKVGDKLLLGPTNGKFDIVLVRSLQCKRVPIDKVDFATYVCIGLRNADKDKIRKGHVIISPKSNPTSTIEFEAEIKVLRSHSTTVREGYEPILHTCSIRQSATLVKVLHKESDRDEEGKGHILRVGDKGLVLFKFKYRPEYMKVGYKLFLSEGKTKAIGEVTRIVS